MQSKELIAVTLVLAFAALAGTEVSQSKKAATLQQVQASAAKPEQPSAIVVSQDTKQASKTIRVCPIEFIRMGKVANFHLDFIYSLTTDKEGIVEKVTKVESRKLPELVREDKIIKCIETWKLNASAKYSVVFSIGTNSIERSIVISESGGEAIKVILQ